AIVFGDLNNKDHAVTKIAQPDHKHGGKPKNPNAFRLLERLGTNPKVYYLSGKQWVREQADNYINDDKDQE
ncbi:MAG: 4Fe-4S dicluster domain-containing protein, partial [Desulfosudaceae bacterium]